jgi:predicted acetyltransferase
MQLEEIQAEHAKAFLTMMEDFRIGDAKTFEQVFQRKNGWNELEFKKYVKECENERMDWRPKAKKISRSHYVIREDPETTIAYGIMQFPLTEETELDGGNLWVAVPPKFRGQGNGSFCLSLLLFEAVRAGLRRALVTCPASDAVSRRMIEKNRGTLLDEVKSPLKSAQNQSIARYWIHFG